MMPTREQRVIRAAKAMGVPRKADISGVQQSLNRLLSTCRQISNKGKGNWEPASQVYSRSEIFAIATQARAILPQIQSLPANNPQGNVLAGNAYDYVQGIAQNIAEDLQRFDKVPAEGFSQRIGEMYVNEIQAAMRNVAKIR